MEKILITGGKGGVGKTTVTASLGLTLALRGERTVLMDGDIGLNNLDAALRAEDGILYDIGDVASGKATVRQALIRIDRDLYLMPSFTACSARVSSEIFAEIADELAKQFKFVLIDCPAGIEKSFLRAANAAKKSIIVTTPHIVGVRDGYKTSKILSGLGYCEQYLVVNRMKTSLAEKNLFLTAEEIEEAVRIPLIGVIPESKELNVNGIADPERKSPVAISYNLIADFLTGKGKQVYDYMRAERGLRGLMRRLKES